MSSHDDYLATIEAITAIPDEQVKRPTIPVDVFLQEAENTHRWCLPDKDPLVAAGLDWTLVESLPVRAGAARESQSLWFKARFSREEAEKAWLAESPAAYELRDGLLHHFRFAFRNQPDLLNRVSEVADGNGHADMIQDLHDLASLGTDHPDLLQAIGFDMTQLDQAAAMADEMADLLSQAHVERIDSSQECIIRDKAYTYLKQALDEIRACGQYVFWRDDERIKGYVSQYIKSRNRKKSAAPKAPGEN